jgi:hypothetical protein
MPLTIVKETIELENVTLDAEGNAWIQKRINLRKNVRHTLTQVDFFEDSIPLIRGTPADPQPRYEFVISPYPQIPTNMDYRENAPRYTRRFAAAGDDSVLFKGNARIVTEAHSQFNQFPSNQIAAQNKSFFYTEHVYINIHFMGIAGSVYGNLALSFMMVFDNKSVPVMEASLGILSESHNAMCAELMSNGHMVSLQALQGNIFPMWRYGGIRPEATISPLAANSFFLPLSNRDAEEMQTSPAIRQTVADARQMNAFNSSFGPRRPDWLREFLNGGYESGPIRANPVPLRYADNGNTRMF